jgi:hypothetical protein
MLAEKELQGRQLMKTKTSFMPRSTSTAPSRTTTPSGAHSSTTNLASRPPSTSLTPSTTAPRATDQIRMKLGDKWKLLSKLNLACMSG